MVIPKNKNYIENINKTNELIGNTYIIIHKIMV